MAADLAVVCRRARIEAGLRGIDIATAAGVSEPTISRLENGVGWRRNAERVVAAYERECGLPPGELWRRAIADDG